MDVGGWVEILPRALTRHGLTTTAVLTILATARYDEPLPDDPTRWRVLGEDDTGQPAEVILVRTAAGQPWIVIHAMPLWPHGKTLERRTLYLSLKGDHP